MKIPIGIDKDSRDVRLIEDVESGLKCNCICPACDSLLVAKKGELKAPHFAHHRSKEGPACRETAVHLMAKYTILRQHQMLLPALPVSSSPLRSLLNEPLQEGQTYFQEPQPICNAKEEVELSEHKIKPDILCKLDVVGSEHDLAIEVAVTHYVDEAKWEKILRAGLSTYEIDLADLVHQETITFEDIELSIQDRSRIKWIHVSNDVTNSLKEGLDAQNKRNLESRNSEIRAWHKELLRALEPAKAIRLPYYQFSESDCGRQIVDLAGKRHNLQIPNPPTIGGQFNLLSVGELVSGAATLILERKGKTHELPVVFSIGRGGPSIPDGSYLKIEGKHLPAVNHFEDFLVWGRSTLADRHKRKVRELREKEIDKKNRNLKAEVHRKMKWLRSIQQGETLPQFDDLDRIYLEYLAAKEELENKGLDPTRVTTNIADGWVFGCPNDYWQVILFRTLCLVDNDGVNVPYYHDNLKKYHGIEAIEPVKSLTYLKGAAESLGHDGASIPSAFKVLTEYFRFLGTTGAISWSGRGRYRKNTPYGKAYQAL